MSRFVHLHTHSHYSLLNALPKIEHLVAAAKANGMSALALTDNGNMYGTIEFYKECKKENIKPIIGVDFYLATRTRFDKQPGVDNRRHRLVLIAENETGYKNLIKLVTTSHLEGFYYKPRIDKELIEKYHDGLIAILPSFSGNISLTLKSGDWEQAGALIDEYKNIFGKENVFLEVNHHPDIEGHAELTERIIEAGKRFNTPLVGTHDVYYISPEDKKARETLLSIQSNGDFEKGGFGNEGDFSFISATQAEEFFKEIPEALENSAKIAERATLDLKLGKWVFPKLEIPEGKSYDDELRRIVYEGMSRRNITETKEVKDRIGYELEIIKNKGYAPYFLVVSDLLHYAHEHKIITTIRGSVAGSLVTYLSGITTVNPLEYKLPFERFLNPERPSAPDIDMDYADNRRDEMIEYARRKYGEDKVAQIGTFGTMMARGAVRDVARALGHPYGVGDRIAKIIPFGSQGFPMSIDRAVEETPELKELYEKDADTKSVIDMARKIEGCARHISIHAAGVVISPVPLEELVPLQYDPKESKHIITQYDMWSIEDAGLLKFDFLGIRNLAILADAITLVKKFKDIDVDIENIPLDDQKTFEMLARGETMGLFQLNGSGMTRFLKELKPSTIHDINAMVALYRPGPMENIPRYIERKHDASKIEYLDPRLKEILSQSYGVVTYQDDVLLIAIQLAGYSWLEADKLRKAMGKKIPAEMEAEKEHLKRGFTEHNISPQKAEMLWKLIEPFAAYGFNKAHAASYGRVAYQTSYMKANFPGEYMTAILTAEAGDLEKAAEIITECKRMGIPVLPPDINESFKDFTFIPAENGTADTIRFGLGAIKNFGEGIAHAIMEERERNGMFTSLGNFLERIKDRNLNKKSLEALILSGALDTLGERGVMLANVEDLLAYNKEAARANQNQGSIFGLFGEAQATSDIVLKPAPAMEKEERLKWEKELLGLYVSGHPLEKFKEKLEGKTTPISQTKREKEAGMIAVVSGIIEDIRPILTKGGDKMLFLRIADFSGSIETVIFPRTFESYKDLLVAENCIAIKGKISHRNGEVSMIAEAIKAL